MELQERSDETSEQERPFTTDKSVADQLLKDHTVRIFSDLNLPALMPYLIQHDCLSDEDIDRFPHADSRKNNNLKFKRLVQQRGVSAFNSFLHSLVHFTRDEKGEGAHRELLDSLKVGIENYSRTISQDSRSTDPLSSVSTTHSRTCDPILVEESIMTHANGDELEAEEGETLERDTPQSALVVKRADTSLSVEEMVTDTARRRSGTPVVDKRYTAVTVKYFLRFAVIFTCIFSPVYFIGGTALIVLSISAFAEGKTCSEIVSAHSLTVFNFFCGCLTLTIPSLLIMLTVYYCCEDRNPAWKREFRICSSKSLVIFTTIAFFLALFVLTCMQVLYALVYVAPQVYTHYADWNQTQCEKEVFFTSFWVLNISGGVMVFLVAVLGVFLSILYFRWVTDPKKPGTLKGIILVVLPQKRRKSISVEG